MGAGSPNKCRELQRAGTNLGRIELSFGDSPKESWSSVFKNAAARTEESCARGNSLTERNQIVLISSGTVQEQNRRAVRRVRRRHETMHEPERILGGCSILYGHALGPLRSNGV